MDVEEHIPVITDFWETVLFQKSTYQKNAMEVHIKLNKETPLTPAHFTTWLKYFKETVDELFEGENAFLIKQRATSIATIMQIKIRQNTAL
jgi:hemoglobin